MRTAHSVVVALVMGGAFAQAQLSACAKTCVDGVFAKPAALNCAASDMLCMCKASTDLKYGIADCINQACGLTTAADRDAQVAAADADMTARCAPVLAQASPISASSAAAPVVTSTQAPAATSVAPIVTPSSSSSLTPSASSSATTSLTGPTSSPVSAAAASSTSLSSTSSAAPTSTGATNTASSTAATGTAAAASATSSASSQDVTSTTNTGLSTAAKAGIGAGVGAVVLIGAIVACCLVCGRRKKEQSRRSSGPKRSSSPFHVKISNPLPGGGRHYASDAEKGIMKPVKTYDSKRYVPRAQPSPKSYHSQSTYDEDIGRIAHRYENMATGAQPKIMI